MWLFSATQVRHVHCVSGLAYPGMYGPAGIGMYGPAGIQAWRNFTRKWVSRGLGASAGKRAIHSGEWSGRW